MISIIEAAKYLVYLSYEKKNSSLTPLKLQKLLYFAQGWSFVWDDKPLFNEDFVAWQYGPVNIEVYTYFHKYGRDEIPLKEGISSVADSDSEKTLEVVWNKYAYYSAFELVELTHSQEPWKHAYAIDQVIKKEDIKSFFQSTY